MTKVLTEMDGLSWREKLPPIPTVPMAVKEKLLQSTATATASAPAPARNAQQNGVKEKDKPGIHCFFLIHHGLCFVCVIVGFLFPKERAEQWFYFHVC